MHVLDLHWVQATEFIKVIRHNLLTSVCQLLTAVTELSDAGKSTIAA
jgi:hypothetical protein